MKEEEINDNLIMLKYFLQEEGDENWQDYCEAIQGLLDLYEKEKEKNINLTQELEKRKWVKIKENGEVEPAFFISKDKIREKIEPKLKELDKQINEEWKKYGNSKELQDMEDMYNFLQQLLEEE